MTNGINENFPSDANVQSALVLELIDCLKRRHHKISTAEIEKTTESSENTGTQKNQSRPTLTK